MFTSYHIFFPISQEISQYFFLRWDCGAPLQVRLGGLLPLVTPLQSSGAISIIKFVLRVNSTRYTEHNTKINIECPQ